MKQHNCEGCGKKFTSSHKSPKYCSYECKYNYWRKKRKQRICLTCGKSYTSKPSENKKYCSFQCYNKNRFGKKLSIETRKKHSESKKGEKNPMWKGDKVGYGSLHDWIRDHKPKPDLCENCKKDKPYDLANISGEYKRDVNDFEWLCRRCHMKKDGRFKNLKLGRKKLKENRLKKFEIQKKEK